MSASSSSVQLDTAPAIVEDLAFDMGWFPALSISAIGGAVFNRLGTLDAASARRSAFRTLREQSALLKVVAFVADGAEITITPFSFFDPSGTEEWSSNSEWRHYLRPDPFQQMGLDPETYGRADRLWSDIAALLRTEGIRFAPQRYEKSLRSGSIEDLAIPEIEKRVLRMAAEVQVARGVNPRSALDTDSWDWQVNIAPEDRADPNRMKTAVTRLRGFARTQFQPHLEGTMIPIGSPTLLDTLAAFRLGGAFNSPVLLDGRAEEIYMNEKNRHMFELYQADTGESWPDPSPPRIALHVATTYVETAVPALTASPADVVLSWKELLSDSLRAYRAEAEELVADAVGIEHSEVDTYVERVASRLDSAYQEVRHRAESSSLRAQISNHLPDWVGGAGAGILTLSATGQPLAAIGTAAASSGVAMLLTAALKSVTEKARLTRHPLYWRMRIDDASPSLYPDPHPGVS